MGRRRRNSPVLERATTRASSLKAISPTLDLGPGLTLAEYEQKIAELRGTQDDYNTLLAQVDEKRNDLEAKEKALDQLSSRMLAGVGARWGRNSTQYEQAGGTRTAERKRSNKNNGDDEPPDQSSGS